MMLDIFSNFDDHNKVIFSTISPLMIWAPLLMVSTMKFWSTTSTSMATMMKWSNIIFNIILRTQASMMGMAYSFIISWSMLVMWMNLTGLMPYVFSLTSHLAMNLSLALPMWLMVVMMSATFNINSYLSHFQPMGSPTALNPFLCLIELISNLVRPITLSVRLAANLSTGHIMLALLGGAYASSSITLMIIIFVVGFFYTFFEAAVCVIQTYIFTLLPSLYSDDHPNFCKYF